ncbi:uncharacterized protein [Onthophagus taurus]|uniref:uncharacterized protein n=1 Tax=Onthophagus taurus TaxID=166361 RepID=UPI0039BE112C
MSKIIIVTTTLFISIYAINTISPSLPERLRDCYRRNFSETIPNVPHNIPVFIELIRKLEDYPKSYLNIRMLATAVFYAAKLDGIEESEFGTENEFVIAFKATNKQFFKFQMIALHFLTGNDERFPYEAFTQEELCILHDLISNSLRSWERGDERYTCEVRNTAKVGNNTRRLLSDCPVEKGVIKTRWGTVSPGHLIAAFIAAFEESHVELQSLMSDISKELNITFDSDVSESVKVNNVLAVTLVGDMAEVIFSQNVNSNVSFGQSGRWNNTMYPREHYLSEHRWDMTEAEFLGGLDGLILARELKRWTDIMSSVRLSQILDMYYSKRGVAFDKTYKACERRSKLVPIFRDFDFAEQINAVAQLLEQNARYGSTVYKETIETYSKKIDDYFKNYSNDISNTYGVCEDEEAMNNLEIIVILDGTWKQDEIFSIISYLAELADVSHYGSKLGIINGQTGEWISNVTNDLYQVFANLRNTTNFPERLHLSTSLNTVTELYQEASSSDCGIKKSRAFGHVVLVFASTALVGSDDATRTQSSMRTLKGTRPDVRIVYVTSENSASHYRNLVDNFPDVQILTTVSREGLEGSRSVVDVVMPMLQETSSSIVDPFCGGVTDVEDYITPGMRRKYLVHREIVARTSVTVRFKGYGYGDVTICARNADNEYYRDYKENYREEYGGDRRENYREYKDVGCNKITGSDEITFDVSMICGIGSLCNVEFSAISNDSNLKCTEMECRYPDQIRMDIEVRWSGSSRASLTLMLIGLVPYVLYESI